MQTWIIQFNPQDWFLERHLQGIIDGQLEREGEWNIHRHFRKMRAGDRVLLWQSGASAGLRAVGELISAAYPASDDASESWFVGYRLSDYLRPALSRSDLKQVPGLHGLSILRRPQGQVFAVNPVESKLLEALYAKLLQPLPLRSDPEALPALVRKIQKQGLFLSAAQIRRYHLALQSGALVILAGASGMGKSWLTRAYAQATGSEYLMVPVAPNWTGPEDLLGYYNALSSSFQTTAVTRFIQDAANHWRFRNQQGLSAKAYHLVLDEINLARVEYYLAPFLSALEVRRRGELASVSLADGSQLKLTENLFLVGTLNMDESTLALSDKVIDRAQFLELHLEAESLIACIPDSPWKDLVAQIWESLDTLVPFSYRSLEDMHRYIERAVDLGCAWETALDEQLVQKILPRLHFLKARHLSVLEALLEQLSQDYPLARRKLQMISFQIQDQGFGSYF